VGCDLYSRHRGGVILSLRWRYTVTTVTLTRHCGGVNFSLCLAKIIKPSDLHNSSAIKYHDFTLLEVLTLAFSCCNFATEINLMKDVFYLTQIYP
jgi:hypothetical protein